MPKHLAIICHLEPIPFRGKKRFSLNLSTMWVNDIYNPTNPAPTPGLTASEVERMKPWKWGPISNLQLCFLSQTGGQRFKNTSAIISAQIVQPPTQTIASQFDSKLLVDVLSHLRGTGTDGPRWNSFSGYPSHPVETTTTDPNQPRYTFADVMAYLSTLPWPIPQALNLSFCFDTDDAHANANHLLCVAPLIDLNAEADGENYTPIDPVAKPNLLQPVAAGSPIYKWTYEENGAAVPIFAYVKALNLGDIQAEATSRFVDLRTYWVKNGHQSTVITESAAPPSAEWVVGLSERTAGGFDLAQRLIDILREVTNTPTESIAASSTPGIPTRVDNQSGTFFRANIGSIRDMVVAALRDGAGMGLWPALGGPSLVDLFLDSVEALPDGLTIGDVKNVLKNYDNAMALEKWKELLREVIPAAGQLTALQKSDANPATPSVTPPLVDLARERDELEQLQATLSDEDTLRRIVLKQWREAINARVGVIGEIPKANRTRQQTAEFDWWLQQQANLDQFFSNLPLRKRLQSSVLKPAWAGIIKPATTAASSSGSRADIDTLRTQFVAEIGKYLRARFALGAAQNNLPAAYRNARPRFDIPADLQEKLEPFLVGTLNRLATSYFDAQVVPARMRAVTKVATPVPHPITLQIDSILGNSDSPSANGSQMSEAERDAKPEDLEVMRRIAGVGVWARRHQRNSSGAWVPKSWHCLNLAGLRAGSKPVRENSPIYGPSSVAVPAQLDPNVDANYSSLAPRSIVPYRLSFQNDIKNVSLIYDNEPLIATSPRRDLSGGKSLKPEVQPDPRTELDELLLYVLARQDATTSSPWETLPFLQFGDQYEFLVHAIGNSGALPQEIADGHPARPKTTAEVQGALNSLVDSTTAEGNTFGAECLHRHFYWRRVQVGSPRFVSPRSTTARDTEPVPSRLEVPAISTGVRPLASEIGTELLTPTVKRRIYFRDEVTFQGLLGTSNNTDTTIEWALTIGGIILRESAFTISLRNPASPPSPNPVASITLRRATDNAPVTLNGTTIPDGGPSRAFIDDPLEIQIRSDGTGISAVARRENSASAPLELQLSGPAMALRGAYLHCEWAGSTSSVSYNQPRFVYNRVPVALPDAAKPLLLLSSLAAPRGVVVTNSFDFRLHKPATDLITWDRWGQEKTRVSTSGPRITLWLPPRHQERLVR